MKLFPDEIPAICYCKSSVAHMSHTELAMIRGTYWALGKKVVRTENTHMVITSHSRPVMPIGSLHISHTQGMAVVNMQGKIVA